MIRANGSRGFYDHNNKLEMAYDYVLQISFNAAVGKHTGFGTRTSSAESNARAIRIHVFRTGADRTYRPGVTSHGRPRVRRSSGRTVCCCRRVLFAFHGVSIPQCSHVDPLNRTPSKRYTRCESR